MKNLIHKQFNLMKLFCATLIIFQHSIATFLSSEKATKSTHFIYGGLLNFSRFSVVIFMIITGFLLIKSYENISFKDFYKNKFTKILKIYLIANFIFIIPKIFSGNYNINSFIIDILWGKSFYHTWYLNTLLKIYLIFPIIKFIVLKLNKFLNSKSIILISIIQFLVLDNAYAILSKSTSPMGVMLFKYLDRSLLLWAYYFILGGLIYKNFSILLKFLNKFILPISILFTISLYRINLKVFKEFSFNNINYVIGSPSSKLLFPYILLSFLVLYYLFNIVTTKNLFNINSILNKYSSYILPLYIIHPLIIGLSYLIKPLTKFLPYNLEILVLITIIIILSFAFVSLYEKFKPSINIKAKEILNIKVKEKVSSK